MKNPNFSNSFIQFLQSIESESRVARLILSTRKMYFDGFISILPMVLTVDEIDYITYRDNGNISYLPNGKTHEENDDGSWKRDGRQEGKPAKIMRKLFTKNALKVLKDSDFEIFNNKYKARYLASGFKFKLLDSNQIPSVYDMDRMGEDGSLNSSCMNNDSDYLEMYANCDKLRILTLTNSEGLLAGRALVWALNYNDESIVFMDRIYVAGDHMYDMFLNYAKENNMWHKVDYKSYSNKRNFMTPSGECVSHNFKVYTGTDFDYYPYIDTFTYGDDGYLCNFTGHSYEYCNTDGTRDGDGRAYDDIEGCSIDADESVYITAGERRYRDRTTHVDNAICVNDEWYYKDDENICYVNGEWYTTSDEDICIVDGEYRHIDDCVINVKTDEWEFEEDCVYSEYSNGHILKSEAYKCGDYYYHEDDVEKVN